MGVVASLVRGRSVNDALTILEHTPRRAAQPMHKLISSAAANAENNHNLKPDTLTIETLQVGHANRGKRYRPAAHGRALPYQLKHSNVHIVVTGTERVKKKAADKKKATKKTDTKPKAEAAEEKS